MTRAEREAALRGAAIVAVPPLVMVAIAIVLPLEVRERAPLFAHRPYEPAWIVPVEMAIAAIALAGTTIGYAAKKRAPTFRAAALCALLALVAAAGVLFLVVVAVGEARGKLGIRPWVALPPLFAVWCILRARHRVGWERWARIVASFAATVLASALLATTTMTAFDRPAIGAALYLLAAGIMVPVGVFSAWPRDGLRRVLAQRP